MLYYNILIQSKIKLKKYYNCKMKYNKFNNKILIIKNNYKMRKIRL